MRDDPIPGLVWLLAPLSLVSFGGGPAIYATLQHEVVDLHQWLTPSQFLDLFAIARAAPGPGIMLTTLIGWKAAGWAGAFLATAAIFIPASILCFGLIGFYVRNRQNAWVVAIEKALAPIAVGLIIAGSLSLLTLEGEGPLNWAITAVAAVIFALRPKLHPFALLGGGAAVYIAASSFM